MPNPIKKIKEYNMPVDTCPVPSAADGDSSSTPNDKGDGEPSLSTVTMPNRAMKESRIEGKPGPFCGNCP